MKKSLSFFLSFFVGLFLSAQPAQKDLTAYYAKRAELCGGIDSVMKKQGSWKKSEDDLAFPDNNFPRNQYKLVNARIDTMFSFFKEALHQLNGIEPRWYRGMRGDAYTTNGPVPYTFNSMYFLYYCNDNLKKILLGDETGTWAYVFVNHYNWFCKKLDDWDIKGDGKKITVYSLPPKAGVWKGKTLYAPQTHTRCLAVVLGHDEKLPWHSLTQKEYLESLKRKWLEEKTKSLASFDETEEKLKSQKLPSNLSPEISTKLRQQRDEDLKNFQQKKEERKLASSKFYDEKTNFIDAYLDTASTQTLQQPAIVDPNSGAFNFKGKFGDEKNGGTRLIDFSTKYFKESLPRYVPQFMILYWRWTDDPVSLSFKKQFEENFPLERLKALIDK